MALNFLGLGASIGIKDMGAAKVASGLATAFGGVGTALAGISGKAALAAAGLGGLAALASGKIRHVADSFADIGMSASSRLTTEFEATAQAHSVSTRRMIAQTGIFGKELNKLNSAAAGMAHGMGMSDQTAAHAVATFSQFKDEMKALGIDSAITAGKVEEGLGVSIRDVAFQMHRLKDGLKLSQKDMEELGKSFAATGEAIHDVGAPFKSMEKAMDLAERRSLLVRQGLSSIGGKDSVKSLNRATQALFTLTGDARGAQEAAVGLEDKLIASMENFRNMFTGNSNDLDAFLINTSVVTGDVQKAFQAAANGPDAFIKEFGGVIAKLKKGGKQTDEILKFFGGQMSEALGPELANKLLLAISNADDAKMKIVNNAKDATQALGKMGEEAWKSPKTLADAYQMAIGGGLAQFRNIGRKAAVEFVKETGSAFKEFNKQAAEVVKKGGPLGAIVEKISEMSSLGAVALLPKSMRPMAAIFGEMYTQIAPSLDGIIKMSGALSGLLNPVTLVAGAIGGFVALVMQAKTASNSWTDAIFAAWEKVKEIFDEYSQKVLTWADEIDWNKVFTTIANGIARGIKMLSQMLTSSSDGIFGELREMPNRGPAKKSFSEVGGKIFTALKNAFGSIEWGKLFGELFSKMKAAGKSIGDQLLTFLNETFRGVSDDKWKSLGQIVGEGIGKLLGFALEQMKENAETAAKVREFLLELGKTFVQALPSFYQGLKDGMDASTGGKILHYLINPVDAMAAFNKWLVEMAELAVKKLGEMWEQVKRGAMIVWDDLFGHSIIPDMVAAGIDHIRGHFDEFLKWVENDVVGRLSGAFTNAVSGIKNLFGGGGDKGTNGAIAADMDASLKTVEAATNRMKDYVQKVLFEGVVEAITKAFDTAFKQITDGSKVFFKNEAKAFQDFANGVVSVFRQMWGMVLDDTERSTNAASAAIGESLKNLQQLKAALEAIHAAQAVARTDSKGEDGKLKRKATEHNALLIETIDSPQWYEEYRGLFQERIGAMIAAIASLKGGIAVPSSGPTIGAARQAVQARPNISFGPQTLGVGPVEGGGR